MAQTKEEALHIANYFESFLYCLLASRDRYHHDRRHHSLKFQFPGRTLSVFVIFTEIQLCTSYSHTPKRNSLFLRNFV